MSIGSSNIGKLTREKKNHSQALDQIALHKGHVKLWTRLLYTRGTGALTIDTGFLLQV